MSAITPAGRFGFSIDDFDFRLMEQTNQKSSIENPKCLAWELNPVRRIKSPLCQPLHLQGNRGARGSRASDGVRIRTPSSGFGDRLLSQEHTAELECGSRNSEGGKKDSLRPLSDFRPRTSEFLTSTRRSSTPR